MEEIKIVTVSYGKVKGKARKYPYYQPAVYCLTQLKKNGEFRWKYLYHSSSKARRSERLAKQDALALADRLNVPFANYIRHNHPAIKTGETWS